MAFSELIKNFDNIRDYMREFYVYGFKSREDYDAKSSRSYDDSRRRIESWLSDYMGFHTGKDGKNVFISVNSRDGQPNPFFKAWKSKSFTDGDITLHFILFDILSEDDEITLKEIMSRIDSYGEGFVEPRVFDISTVRKKLAEYETEGLVRSRKEGREVFYRSAPVTKLPSSDLLRFYSEVFPCGVAGSFIEDKLPSHEAIFRFKHHYVTSTMDSGIVLQIFEAMERKCLISIEAYSRRRKSDFVDTVIPLQIRVSTQSGRQHLLGFSVRQEKIVSIRIDHILSVKLGEETDIYDDAKKKLRSMEPHIWGVSVGTSLEHVEFVLRYGRFEDYIPGRLEREKRTGTVTYVGEGLVKFEADVYDAFELMPWIRTFIGRIVSISFSNDFLLERFKRDIEAMEKMYGGGEDAVQ